MLYLKVSTAATLKIGPFIDDTDGKTPKTSGLTIAQADVLLSKNGGSFTQKNESSSATHDANGFYSVSVNTTDTNTVGRIQVSIKVSGALSVFVEYMVLPAVVFDSLVGGSDNLEVDLVQWRGTQPNNLVSNRVDASVGAMASGVLTATAIASNAITAAKIATDAITADKIAADAIGSSEFAQAAADKVWSTASRQITGATTNIPANTVQIEGGDATDAIAAAAAAAIAASEPVDANLVQIGGNSVAGNAATLTLKQLSIINNAGDAIVAQSTGSNGRGAVFQGNGSGSGVEFLGGASGAGAKSIGYGANAYGFYIEGAGAGSAIHCLGGNNGGSAIAAIAQGAGDTPAIAGYGVNGGAGLSFRGGTTGNGFECLGGTTSGAGFYARAQAQGAGAEFVGGQAGSGNVDGGNGLKLTGGAGIGSGNGGAGLYAIGGNRGASGSYAGYGGDIRSGNYGVSHALNLLVSTPAGGDAIHADAGIGPGAGMSLQGGGVGGHGLKTTGGGNGEPVGDGIRATGANGYGGGSTGDAGAGFRAIGGAGYGALNGDGGAGIAFVGGAKGGTGTDGVGALMYGTGAAAGLRAESQFLGAGIQALGGTTSGEGFYAAAQGAGTGLKGVGIGAGHGAHFVSGNTTGDAFRAEVTPPSTGHGVHGIAGVNGDGANFQALGGTGNGLKLTGAGGGHGLYSSGGVGGHAAYFYGAIHGIYAKGGAGSAYGGDGFRAEGGPALTGDNDGGAGIRSTGGAKSGAGLDGAGFVMIGAGTAKDIEADEIGTPVDLGDGASLAAGLTAIAGKTASAASYDRATDSNEAIRDRGDAAWTTGGASLTAQEVRDAMKLAPTAGAPAAGSVDEALDNIETDTGNIETKVDTVDGVVDAIKAKTDNLPADPASEGNVTAVGNAVANVDSDLAAVAADVTTIDGKVDVIDTNVDAIVAKLPAGTISDLSLSNTVDGKTLEYAFELLMAMANGRFKIDTPTIGQTTIYKRDNVTVLTVLNTTLTERTRVS